MAAVTVKIELTWSKLMALVILIESFTLDVLNDTNTTFQIALPFVVILITGKQVVDWRKNGILKKKENGTHG